MEMEPGSGPSAGQHRQLPPELRHLAGSDFYREQYGQNDNLRYQADYQWANEERERMYFTAPSENVGDYESVDRPDVEVTGTAFKGFSKYVAERSVIDGSVFTTDFNNGHGMQYFEGGEVIRDVEWTNVNLQDILPTWQVVGGEYR